MPELVEILDGAGIDSTRINCWMDASYDFMAWYIELKGPCKDMYEFEKRLQSIDPIDFQKACLKIETKMDIPFYNKKKFYE